MKKKQRTNALLAVELFSNEYFFATTPKAKTQQVSEYFIALAKELKERKYKKAHIFIDNNATHKDKMKQMVKEHISKQDNVTQLIFHHFPPYSPELNLVEYLIHLIRQRWLHHADFNKRLEQVEKEIEQKIKQFGIMTKEQIINTLQHIENLVANKILALSTQRE